MSFFVSGGKPKQDAASAAKATAQEFVNVKDIRGNLLYTKDGYIFVYIKLQPISIGLLSREEQTAFLQSLVSELSVERKAFRLDKLGRPVDITGLVNEYSDLIQKTTNPVCKKMLREEISFMSSIAVSGEILEDQFYILLWAHTGQNAADELLKRARDFITRLDNAKLRTSLCDQPMIVQLCNLYANPAYAHMESADIAPSIPLLEIT